MSQNIVSVTLRNGAAMPLVGLGTWKAEKGVVGKAVEVALKNGYTHLDCACDYGNEEEVGQGIKAAIDAGTLERKDLFVTSKLWNTYHAKDNVRPACERTLKDLGLDYLDLYLIHFPISLKYVPFDKRYPPEWCADMSQFPMPIEIEDVTVRETWTAMEELVEAGLVKNIGVANFNCALLMDLLKYAKIPPAVNQIEYHPHLQQPTLVKFCQERNIAITAYSSFGGLSYAAFNPVAKATPSLLEDAEIKKISAKYGKSNAQVILRWSVQQNIIVIPKSTNEGRLKQNLDVFDFDLTAEEMETMKTLNKNLRFNNPGNYCNYPIFD